MNSDEESISGGSSVLDKVEELPYTVVERTDLVQSKFFCPAPPTTFYTLGGGQSLDDQVFRDDFCVARKPVDYSGGLSLLLHGGYPVQKAAVFTVLLIVAISFERRRSLFGEMECVAGCKYPSGPITV